jgi:hypothetical protein
VFVGYKGFQVFFPGTIVALLVERGSHPPSLRDPAKTGFALAQTRFPLVEPSRLFAASKTRATFQDSGNSVKELTLIRHYF